MKIIYALLLLMLLSATETAAQHRWYRSDELKGYMAPDIALDQRGRLWAIIGGTNATTGKTDYYVQGHDGVRWNDYSTSEFDYPLRPSDYLWDIATDNDGNVIVAAQNAILVLNPVTGKWSMSTVSDTLHERSFHHLFTDSKGRVWITGQGRFVLKRDTINGTTVSHVRAYNQIYQLVDGMIVQQLQTENDRFFLTNPAEDKEGNIWFAYQTRDSNGGLIRYDNEQFTVMQIPLGSKATRGPTALTLHIDSRDNSIHVGSQRGSDRFGNHYPAMFSTLTADLLQYSDVPYPYSTGAVHSIAEMHAGSIFVGTRSGLYEATDPPRFIDFRDYFPDYPDHTAELLPVYDVKASRNGYLYCGTRKGIVVLDFSSSRVGAEGAADLHIGAYPNPALRGEPVSFRAILHEGERVQSIQIFNTIGERMMAIVSTDISGGNVFHLDTQSLTPGAYLVAIHTSRGRKQAFQFVIAE